jgi:hypothetical protein
MKLIQLLLELDFKTYEAMVQVKYGEDGISGYDDALRALPGITTVTKASESAESGMATYKIKLISQKDAITAFKAFKDNAKAKYSNIIAIKVGEQTIEEK